MKTYPGTNILRPDGNANVEQTYALERVGMMREIATAALQGLLGGRQALAERDAFSASEAMDFADILLVKLEAPTPT